MRRLLQLWWMLVRFGFRLLYNELAWTYDLVSTIVSLGRWRRWQQAGIDRLNVTPGQRVLEIAHGTGDTQIDLVDRGFRSIALDRSVHMGRIARRKLARSGRAFSLTQGDAAHLPYPDACFDGILSTFPTPFVFESQTIAEAYRVLRPGFRYVIVANGLLTLNGPVARVLEWVYRITGQRESLPAEEILERFIQAGFAPEFVQEELPGSIVMMVVAKKADSGQSDA